MGEFFHPHPQLVLLALPFLKVYVTAHTHTLVSVHSNKSTELIKKIKEKDRQRYDEYSFSAGVQGRGECLNVCYSL